MTRFVRHIEIAVALSLSLTAGVLAQDASTAPTTQPAASTKDHPPTTQPAASPTTQPATRPDAQQIEQDMMGMLSDSPLFVPTQQPQAQPNPNDVPPSALSVEIDTSVLGIPPGGEQPTLRREGEFIINRRGRLIRAPNSGHVLFLFEADSETAPEPPMPLVPCQILQNMEDLVQERSDKVVFILSGQVMLYRGVNFLLPTMMKLAIDRGNLQN